jgi:hypothetical protein
VLSLTSAAIVALAVLCLRPGYVAPVAAGLVPVVLFPPAALSRLGEGASAVRSVSVAIGPLL